MGKLLFFALLLFFASFAYAQNTDFSATAPAKITADACAIAESQITVTNLADFPASFSFSLQGKAAKWATVADALALNSGSSGSVTLYLNLPCDALGSYELMTRIRSDLGREKVLRQVVHVPGKPSALDFSGFFAFLTGILSAKLLLFLPLFLLLLVILLAVIRILTEEKPEQVKIVETRIEEKPLNVAFVVFALLFVLALLFLVNLAIFRAVLPVFRGNAANVSVANVTTHYLANLSMPNLLKPLFSPVNLTANFSVNLPKLPSFDMDRKLTINLGFLTGLKSSAVRLFGVVKPYFLYILLGLLAVIVIILIANYLGRRGSSGELYTSVKLPKVAKISRRKKPKHGFKPSRKLVKVLVVLLLAAVILFSFPYYSKVPVKVKQRITLPEFSLPRPAVAGLSELTLNVKDFLMTYAPYIVTGVILLFLLIIIINRKEKG